MRVAAILSMLHEPADANSATRLLRNAPVLQWTIDRLRKANGVAGIGILCWDDQLAATRMFADPGTVTVLPKGVRRAIPELDRITVARTWSDGWRGGLHSTCAFDAGFYAPWIVELADLLKADAVLLAPPSAAMVDPQIAGALIERATCNTSLGITFSAAAPGLGGAVVTRALLNTLVTHGSHPGRLLHYMPEQPMLDPVGGEGCVSVPASVSRTRESFLIDSDRRARRFTAAAHPLNGQLMTTGAEELARRLSAEPADDAPPRDVTIELNTTRSTTPIYLPVRDASDAGATLDLRAVFGLLNDLKHTDDIRLTIGGRGDPLDSPILFDVVAAARAAKVASIHVETDLATFDAKQIVQLASSEVDIVSLFLPALSPDTYATVMGTDAMKRVLDNLKTFVTVRAARGRGTPLVVPTFVKLAANLAEMDAWYDQWLSALGVAVIVGPRALGAARLELADMSPAMGRNAADRPLRLYLRCDGSTTTCDADVIALSPPLETQLV